MPSLKKLLIALIPLLLFSLITLFLLRGLKRNPHTVPSPFIGRQISEFSVASLEFPESGSHRNFLLTNKIFQGQVSILNVFASWCLYCRTEHPILMDIENRLHLTLYGLDYKDKRVSAIKWLKQYGDPYTKIIFDPRGKLAINLGVYGTPETFIIDKNGIIRYRYVGPVGPNEWKDKLLPIVERLQREKT